MDLSPTPFSMISAGDVHALIPKRWTAQPLAQDALRQGVVASPHPELWARGYGSVPGLEVSWVDIGRAGIPTHYWYLAASGPAIPRLAESGRCTRSAHRVLLDHRPAFGTQRTSPSDYVVRASGHCDRKGDARDTRWAYFVAAPGFGPLRDIGLPTSGLYTVVAVVHDRPDADKRLRRMVMSARFGQTSVFNLIRAARGSQQL
jgi:hypothetical protein